MDAHLFFPTFRGKRLHNAITGSVAAYRMADVHRWWQSVGISTSAVLSQSGEEFLPALTLRALGADPVQTEWFGPSDQVFSHLQLDSPADAMVLAPATANTLARLASGLADTLCACQLLAFRGPLVIAPAMNPRLWSAPQTRRNWQTLREMGYILLEPDSGRMACGDEGAGRLPDPRLICMTGIKTLSPQDLQGKKVLVSLGPTREHWDPARFWSNPSTGTMGAAMAVAAWLRGAEVHVVQGPVSPWLPPDIFATRVTSAREMDEACNDLWPAMDIGCLTAAVCDFRPAETSPHKRRKAEQPEVGICLEFSRNPDILAGLGRNRKSGQRLIGFAAETRDLAEQAKSKLAAKNCDLLAANPIHLPEAGFAAPTNRMTVVDRSGRLEEWPLLHKGETAWRLWDWLIDLS